MEFPTGVGPIDILAIDETDALVVFELKRAHSPDRAIGQFITIHGVGAADHRQGETGARRDRGQDHQ